MEKEQIISTLKEKVGQTSLSDRSLNDYVEANLPTDEPDDAYWTKHVGVIRSISNNFSFDVAKTLKEQIGAKAAEYYKNNPEALKEFLKAHPVETVAEPQGTVAVGDKENEKVKKLEEQVAELLRLREEDKKEKSIQYLRSSAKKEATKLNVKRVTLWEDAAEKVAVSEGETISSFIDKVKVQYSQDLKRYFGDGEKPYNSVGNTGGGDSGNKVINDYFAKKKAKMGK